MFVDKIFLFLQECDFMLPFVGCFVFITISLLDVEKNNAYRIG